MLVVLELMDLACSTTLDGSKLHAGGGVFTLKTRSAVVPPLLSIGSSSLNLTCKQTPNQHQKSQTATTAGAHCHRHLARLFIKVDDLGDPCSSRLPVR
jgi:hypothetical protein